MDCPEMYIQNNDLQQRSAEDTLNKFIDKMTWTSNEIILDLGCGPGDVTTNILFKCLKDKISQLVGADKSQKMIEYAQNTYGCSNNKIHFKVLDIECADDCKPHLYCFNKLFSFFCFHWVENKYDALVNMNTMLKSGGEILVQFLLFNPFIDVFKCMDTEWQKYVMKVSTFKHSQEDIENVFIKAGFRIIHIESIVRKFTFPDISSLLDYIRPIHDMYNVIPPHLHKKYTIHLKEKMNGSEMFHICSTTGKTTQIYLSTTVHAIKD